MRQSKKKERKYNDRHNDIINLQNCKEQVFRKKKMDRVEDLGIILEIKKKTTKKNPRRRRFEYKVNDER